MPESPSLLRAQLTSGAACRYDPELHDGPGHAESAQERDARVAVAIEVCAGCPVLAACEAYRVRVRPESGVWAGQVIDSRDLAALTTSAGYSPAELAIRVRTEQNAEAA